MGGFLLNRRAALSCLAGTLFFGTGLNSQGALAPVPSANFKSAYAAAKPKNLAAELVKVRERVLRLQSDLLDKLRHEKQAKENIRKIHQLLALQHEEQELGARRLRELEGTVLELEDRRRSLQEKIRKTSLDVRASLKRLAQASQISNVEESSTQFGVAAEEWSVRRKVLGRLTERGFKEVEALRIDLEDSEVLHRRIVEEKQQVVFLLQDLEEQRGILELNRQLQADVLKKNFDERVTRLENYRKLKLAENQVENLIQDFNARIELETVSETEKQLARFRSEMRPPAKEEASLRVPRPLAPKTSPILGRANLSLPVRSGKILTGFGRVFDPKTGLHIFKKGLEIAVGHKNEEVLAVAAGKVVYSGELPDYGRVAIVDHGDHLYSLVAHLGGLLKKVGDSVGAGELLGSADDAGSPVYFEIRSRNVAVNPLQWLAN